MLLAILGNHAHPQADGMPRIRGPNLPAVQIDVSAVEMIRAEDGSGHLRSARAHQAGQPQDLAPVELEGYISDLPAAIQSLDPQDHLADLPLDGRESLVQRAAHHHADQLAFGGACDVHRAHELAVLQDGGPIGDLKHLVQAVRDVDDGDPLLLQRLDDVEQGLQLMPRQHRGRLVHDHDLRVHQQRLGDLHQLLLGHAEIHHLLADVHLHPNARQGRLGLLSHLPPMHSPPHGTRRSPQGDVLGDAHIGKQIEFLIDDAHPQGQCITRIADLHLLALDLDLSLIRLVVPGQDLDQGGFSRPILPHQGVDLAPTTGEIDILQRLHPRERLAHPPHFQCVFFGHTFTCPESYESNQSA